MAFLLIVMLLGLLCVFVASIAISVNGFQRLGRERGLPGLLCPIGIAMTFGFFLHELASSAAVGASGGTRQLQSLLDSVIFAILGIALAITGWVKTHPREFPVGCCQKCGYELKDLPRCPECGTDRPATTNDDAESAGGGSTIPPTPTPLDASASKENSTR